MTDDDLRHTFGHKVPGSAAARQACIDVRTGLLDLAHLVVAQSPAGRAQAMAVSALQQAGWACIAALSDQPATASK